MEPRPLRLLAATVLFINGIVSAQSGHLAEYIRPEASKALMENAYIVHFVECGYSLEQHASFMAENITAYDEFYDFDWLPGYRAIFDTDTLDRVRSDPGVKLVEHDMRIQLDEEPHSNPAETVEEGLQLTKRFEHMTMDSPYEHRMVTSSYRLQTPVERGPRWTFQYAGLDATIYVLDSGVRITHESFQGRASHFRNLAETPYTRPYETMNDLHGHGTNIAGIAGSHFGSAPSARIVNVKVVNATGQTDAHRLAQAVRDIAVYHRSRELDPSYRGGVINISLAWRYSRPNILLRQAIQYALGSGLVVVASAGNHNKDAGRAWPCNYAGVICVGATDDSYRKADFSSFGEIINVWAPGTNITTLGHLNDREYIPASEGLAGTSFATAIVTGLAAVAISWERLYDATYTDPDPPYGQIQTVAFRLFWNAIRDTVAGLTDRDNNLFASIAMDMARPGIDEPYYGAGPPSLLPV